MNKPSSSRVALTVDVVVLGFDAGELKVLLRQRKAAPFSGQCELPGGTVRAEETLEQAAARALAEKAGLQGVFLEQLFTFGAPERDPRERAISVAYFALVKLGAERGSAPAGQARDGAWFSLSALPPAAFDHGQIVAAALARLKGKVRYQPLGFELLPPKFTLSQLQRLYETILERPLDKRNFRKKILGMDLLVETAELQTGVKHRAARLYAFDEEKYRRLFEKGFNFEI